MVNLIKSFCLLMFSKAPKEEAKIDERLVAAGDPARNLSGIARICPCR